MAEYTIKYKDKNLSTFSPNGLPIVRSNFKNDVFGNNELIQANLSDVFRFSNNDYIVFGTEEDALKYIKYIKQEVKNNLKRYCKYCNSKEAKKIKEKLNSILQNLKIIEIIKENKNEKL